MDVSTITSIYVLIKGSDWDDIVVILSKEDAIQASVNNPHCRVEIFRRNEFGYIPSYHFYRNGEYIAYGG